MNDNYKTVNLPIEYLQNIVLGTNVRLSVRNKNTVEFQFKILPRDERTCKVEWRCDNQTGTLTNVAIGSEFYKRLNGI